jgi:hypothetical protein
LRLSLDEGEIWKTARRLVFRLEIRFLNRGADTFLSRI